MKPKMTYPSHIRAVLTLGVPLIGGYLGEIAIQTTDTVMSGWYEVEALAAVTLGTTYFFVLFIFGTGFAWAVMPLVATFAAKDDEQGIRRATRMGLWLSVAFAALALPLGTVPLAAHGIALQVTAVTFILHMGLSNVATIRAGNAFGRGDTPHMVRGAQVVTAMSLVIAGLSAAVYIVWPDALIRLFIRPGEDAAAQILAIGAVLLFMAALFQIVDAVQLIAMGLLRGVQGTRMPMIFAGVSYWIVGLSCSYILGFPLGYGGVGVWAGLVIALSVAAVLMNMRFWLVTIRQLPA